MSISRWMDKKAVVHIHNGVLLSHEKEYIWISSNEMDETGADYTEWSKPERKTLGADYTEWSKPERKTPIQYTKTYIWDLERWQWWPCMQTAKETQMCRADFWNLTERERVGWFGRMALKHIYYHVRNESPVYVWCRMQDAWGWCTGMTQRDVMGREVEGGSSLETHVHPWWIHVNVCQNQYDIVK